MAVPLLKLTKLPYPSGVVFVLLSAFSLPENMTSEQVVHFLLVVLRSYHQREAEKLNEILTGFNELYVHKLVSDWETFRKTNTPKEALKLLTEKVSAELDGGNGPIPDSLAVTLFE
ncbi:MAG: hypothetical protein K2X01_11570 [Cyanobacteria bacterium]|nr:hypothetical protein [Cyanobacteriota bacterium]